MSEKTFFHPVKTVPVQKIPRSMEEHVAKAQTQRLSTAVRVRDKHSIPTEMIDFFKFDPRSQAPYLPQEKVLHAQVLLHELDEGVRLLEQRRLYEEAKMVQHFSKPLQLASRLELLRKLLAEYDVANQAPLQTRGAFKVRGNQAGALRGAVGIHPVVALTEAGVHYKVRNEDGFLLLPAQKVLALADGMGGHVGGHVASCVAIDFFEAAMRQGSSLEEAIGYANEALRVRMRYDPDLGGLQPMGSTFAAAQIKHTLLKTAHVGDTKILVIRDDTIVFETQDHTQGQELLREGLVDHATALELNHVLNRCLGLDAMHVARDVEVASFALRPGDRILLATDGVTDNFFDKKFRLGALAQLVAFGPLTRAAEKLAEACRYRMSTGVLPDGQAAKHDNFSFILLEVRA